MVMNISSLKGRVNWILDMDGILHVYHLGPLIVIHQEQQTDTGAHNTHTDKVKHPKANAY